MCPLVVRTLCRSHANCVWSRAWGLPLRPCTVSPTPRVCVWQHSPMVGWLYGNVFSHVSFISVQDKENAAKHKQDGGGVGCRSRRVLITSQPQRCGASTYLHNVQLHPPLPALPVSVNLPLVPLRRDPTPRGGPCALLVLVRMRERGALDGNWPSCCGQQHKRKQLEWS